MPIEGIAQPETLAVSDAVRLRRYDGRHGFALPWYQDPETVRLVDGDERIYTEELLERMYAWQDGHGEFYWIEVLEDGAWRPAGDVWLAPEDFAIVIGERARRRGGLGRGAVSALADRARSLGWERVRVGEVYRFNAASRRLFASLGFREEAETEKGSSYVLPLREE